MRDHSHYALEAKLISFTESQLYHYIFIDLANDKRKIEDCTFANLFVLFFYCPLNTTTPPTADIRDFIRFNHDVSNFCRF